MEDVAQLAIESNGVGELAMELIVDSIGANAAKLEVELEDVARLAIYLIGDDPLDQLSFYLIEGNAAGVELIGVAKLVESVG